MNPSLFLVFTVDLHCDLGKLITVSTVNNNVAPSSVVIKFE